MRKVLLVIMIGMVIVMDLYGAVSEIVAKIEENNAKNSVRTVVYVE